MKCQPQKTHLNAPRFLGTRPKEEKWYTGKSKAEAAAKAEKDLGQKASCQLAMARWPGGQFDHFWEDKNSQETTTNNNKNNN